MPAEIAGFWHSFRGPRVTAVIWWSASQASQNKTWGQRPGFPETTRRATIYEERRGQGGTDHASLRFSLPGLQQRIHPDSSHRGSCKGRCGVSTLSRHAGDPKGSGVLRGYLQEKLDCASVPITPCGGFSPTW